MDGRVKPGHDEEWVAPLAAQTAGSSRPPNIILVYVDDLGYGDLGCFGAKKIKTPNLDRMAKQGTRFTSFYVAQAVCTASRAALMSGCYANRVSLFGALNHVSREGIAASELLIQLFSLLDGSTPGEQRGI